jgi:type II secretion system protein H
MAARARKMTSRIGRPQNSGSRASDRRAGVTLLELILVMAILLIVMAIAVPQLKGFTAGRRYDAEWNRFMASLRYARNEAISRSTPVQMRFDAERGSYSFSGGYGFDHLPDGATEHVLPEELSFEFPETSDTTATGSGKNATTGSAMNTALGLSPDAELPKTSAWAGTQANEMPTILFWPDGTVDESSPQSIRIVERDGVFQRSVQRDPALGYAATTEGTNVQTPAK